MVFNIWISRWFRLNDDHDDHDDHDDQHDDHDDHDDDYAMHQLLHLPEIQHQLKIVKSLDLFRPSPLAF